MLLTSILSGAILAGSVAAHGNIVIPAIRQPGEAFKAACGDSAYNLLTADPTRSHQNLIAAAPSDPTYNAATCNFWLCKGIPYADNKSHTMKFPAGKQLSVEYAIRIPHPGYANLSVVDTRLNKPIGTPLKVFDSFGSTNNNTDELDWSFIMSDVRGRCRKAGTCVLQFWWHSDQVDQTYASCVDFVQ